MANKTPNKEVLDFLATLDADFGKKKKSEADKDNARSRNKAFHQQNPQLDSASGKAPELDQSGNWQAIARVTYVIRQNCLCCNNTVEFIGGEYIQWKSKKQHATILRDAAHSAGLFLYDEIGEPIPDLIDEMKQSVSRCPGCIAVERQALQIWNQALEQQRSSFKQGKLDIDLSKEVVSKELPNFEDEGDQILYNIIKGKE